MSDSVPRLNFCGAHPYPTGRFAMDQQENGVVPPPYSNWSLLDPNTLSCRYKKTTQPLRKPFFTPPKFTGWVTRWARGKNLGVASRVGSYEKGTWYVAKGNYPAVNSCCSVGSADRLYEYEEQGCGAAYQHDPHDEPRKNHS